MKGQLLPDLTVRRANPADTDRLAELIGKAFPDNPKADPELLRWQYWNNPGGSAVSWVAEADDGQLVSQFAVLPLHGMVNGHTTRVARPADAATLPSAQGRGLMGRLSEAVSRDCAAEGIAITICTPNFKARGALMKVGLRTVGRLRALVRPLDDQFLRDRFRVPKPLGALGRRMAFGRKLPTGATRITAPPDDLSQLLESHTPAGTTGVLHDATYWKWRYLDSPVRYDLWELRREGRLLGVATSRVRDAYGGRFLSLLDLVAADEDVARRLVGSAVASADGADGLATLAVPGSRIDVLARSCGMRPLPQRLEPQPAILGYLANDPAGLVPDDQSWSISWCEMDFI